MPILVDSKYNKFSPKTIPMNLLNEWWAQSNHGQSLTRLAERGGLSPSEIVANIEKRPWNQMDEVDAISFIKEIAAVTTHDCVVNNSPLRWYVNEGITTLQYQATCLQCGKITWKNIPEVEE